MAGKKDFVYRFDLKTKVIVNCGLMWYYAKTLSRSIDEAGDEVYVVHYYGFPKGSDELVGVNMMYEVNPTNKKKMEDLKTAATPVKRSKRAPRKSRTSQAKKNRNSKKRANSTAEFETPTTSTKKRKLSTAETSEAGQDCTEFPDETPDAIPNDPKMPPNMLAWLADDRTRCVDENVGVRVPVKPNIEEILKAYLGKEKTNPEWDKKKEMLCHYLKTLINAGHQYLVYDQEAERIPNFLLNSPNLQVTQVVGVHILVRSLHRLLYTSSLTSIPDGKELMTDLLKFVSNNFPIYIGKNYYV